MAVSYIYNLITYYNNLIFFQNIPIYMEESCREHWYIQVGQNNDLLSIWPQSFSKW